MTTTAERIQLADLEPAERRGARRPLGALGGLVAIGLAVWSLGLVNRSTSGDYVRMSVVALWALCAVSLVWRRPRELMGFLMLGFAGAGALWAVGAGLQFQASGARHLGEVLRALGISLLP